MVTAEEKAIIGRSPMIQGGVSVTDLKGTPSIWRRPDALGNPRVNLPGENPKYPETKHTMPKLLHNIGQFPMTDRPGTETYDPVLQSGRSVRRQPAATPAALAPPCAQLTAPRAPLRSWSTTTRTWRPPTRRCSPTRWRSARRCGMR